LAAVKMLSQVLPPLKIVGSQLLVLTYLRCLVAKLTAEVCCTKNTF